MIPSIQSIVEMLIVHECTAQQALAWIAEYVENEDLRDQFAGQALAVKFGNSGTNISVDDMAEKCYAMADAMLKARGAK